MTQVQGPSQLGLADGPEPGATTAGRSLLVVATFLAIDLAESSAVLDRLGEGRVESARAAYLTLLRNAVAAHHGRELWRRGDGVLAVFDVPSDAVACAVAVLRAAERHNKRGRDRLDVRIGIQLGEADVASAVSDHGDYAARPAIQARQLCDAAAGGQVLVSDAISVLAGSEASHTFERVGLLTLDGVADPVPTFEVARQSVPSERPPLPAELAARPRGRCSFVGRAAERERIRAIWSAAASGERRLTFVLGEPGIGKSRLAAEFAAEAHADGGAVLSGRSFEESIVPYQPFVEALRQYVVDCDPIDLQAQLGGDPAPLVTLLPELATRISATAADGPDSAGGERYRLFDAVAAFLSTISMSSPVLLVLDDLHWADPATLLLLKHIVLDPRPASLLILGLYRDNEVAASHPLTLLQADIEHDFRIDRVALGGLEDEAVASMLDEMIHWSPPDAVAKDLRHDTEGNPFFLQEVIHQLDATGVAADRERMAQGHLVSAGPGVPSRVRDFVTRRMQRISAGALEALGVAAIVGTEFSLDVLGVVLALGDEALLDRLDEAVEASLVVEAPDRAGVYAFAHGLFQQALHEGHSTNRRAALHARVAEAIETLHPDDPGTLSDLARHYALTAGRYAEKVVRYGSAAGDRAFLGLAYEDAIDEYTRALDSLPLATSASELTRADLLVRLGESQTRVGDSAAAKRSFRAAAEHCVDADSSAVLARAALGYGGTGRFGGIFDPYLVVDETLVSLLDRAIDACPPGDEPIRIRLQGRLAQALYWSDDKERMHALSREALDAARRLGDRATLAYALHSRHVALWGPDHVAEMRSVAQEMLSLGTSLGDREIQLKAYTWLITDTLETDSIEAVDEHIAGYARLAEELKRPYLLGYVGSIHATRAHLEGRFEDMARLVSEQLTDSTGAYVVRAKQAYRWQMRLLDLDLGRIDDELIDELADGAARFPRSIYSVMLALAFATLGRHDEASTELATLVEDGPAAIPRDCMWSATMAMLSRTVSKLGAVEHARPLYDLQIPFSDRNCLWGSGFMSFGPISRYLGMLATTFGEPGLALEHLEHALGRSRDLRSPPLMARTKVEMARALLARSADGDGARARALLEEAGRTATELGMARLAEDVDGLISAVPASGDVE